MEQPDLGNKLADLRQQRGMTQDELVEACNVSIRTIQRIEAGDVTPRMSTVKILLAALEAELSDIKVDEKKVKLRPSRSTKNWMQIGWISGLVYLLIGCLEAIVDYHRFSAELLGLEIGDARSVMAHTAHYVAIKSLAILSFSLFGLAIVKLAAYFNNYLLKISYFLIVCSVGVMSIIQIGSLFFDLAPEILEVIFIGGSITVGVLGIIVGVGWIRLQDGMGKLSLIVGVFEMIVGACFLTVLLFFVGYLFLIPTVILEIILLFKAYEYLKSIED